MSKVWFVTGSSRGLGRAFVEVALEAGDRVVATARNPERLKDLLDTYGDRVLALRLDVTDYDAAVRAVAQAVERFGRIDVAVNSAGYSDLSSFEDTTIDSFRTQVDTNFYGVVNVSKAVVPILREQGHGHLIQVSSLSARFAAPGLTAYQAAKWAVTGFSSGLAHELAPFGVKITVLEPGGMRTDWAGSSMTIPQPTAPYQPTIGAFAELVRAASGHEATSARRVAQVVRDIAGRDDAPPAPAARHRRRALGAAGGTGTRRQRRGLARRQSQRLRRYAPYRRYAPGTSVLAGMQNNIPPGPPQGWPCGRRWSSAITLSGGGRRFDWIPCRA